MPKRRPKLIFIPKTVIFSLEMLLNLLHLFNNKPRLAILMSGNGSNARAILENQGRYPNLNFAAIATDNPDSNAESLAKEFGLTCVFFAGPYNGAANRQARFEEISRFLEALDIDALLYSGFMKIAPAFFIEKYPGLNIHPADLTIKDNEGMPLYRGMKAVQAAIENGETRLASTVHMVEDRVDCGAPIAVSKPLIIPDNSTLSVQQIHEKLKTECEHALLPDTLELLAKGGLAPRDLPIMFANDNKPAFC